VSAPNQAGIIRSFPNFPPPGRGTRPAWPCWGAAGYQLDACRTRARDTTAHRRTEHYACRRLPKQSRERHRAGVAIPANFGVRDRERSRPPVVRLVSASVQSASPELPPLTPTICASMTGAASSARRTVSAPVNTILDGVICFASVVQSPCGCRVSSVGDPRRARTEFFSRQPGVGVGSAEVVVEIHHSPPVTVRTSRYENWRPDC
jgi:hypothetical protein